MMYKYTEFPIRRYPVYKKTYTENKEKVEYTDNIFTLDTETSSFFNIDGKFKEFDYTKPPEYYIENKEKFAVCYIWMLSVDGDVYYGRYLEDLRKFLKTLHEYFKGAKIFCYVHNLPFDFQFLRNVLRFDNVFVRQPRKPYNGYCSEFNIEFRDSYVLSMMSLENLAKEYKLPVQKKVGELDYNKTRLPVTILSEKEKEYCEYDCLVLHEYIKMKKIEVGNVKKIAMTQTGEVRRSLKNHIKLESLDRTVAVKGKVLKHWKQRVSKLTPDLETYKELVAAYAGGYTHASSIYAGKVLHDVSSWDFGSSYPYVMLTELYPNTNFEKTTETLDEMDFENFAYILTLEFKDIRSKLYNNFISVSKCESTGFVNDNGRVKFAKYLKTTVTEQDWLTIKESYSFSEVKVISAKRAMKGELPYPLLALVKEKYTNKAQYKNVLGKEALYIKNKQQLNGIYGMCVTNYIGDEVDFVNDDLEGCPDGWEITFNDDEKTNARLGEMSDEDKPVLLLPYQWGVWISAYARRNLWKGIIAMDDSIVYCDTDSHKIIGEVPDYIFKYNEGVHKKLVELVKRVNSFLVKHKHEIFVEEFWDISDFDGMGIYDNDGQYSEFVTLGAKKYCYRPKPGTDKHDPEGAELHITLSGVNKKGFKALKNDIENFREGTCFGYGIDEDGKEYNDSGSNYLFYNDNQEEVELEDYQGNKETIYQKHSIIIQPTTYILGVTETYRSIIGSKDLINI